MRARIANIDQNNRHLYPLYIWQAAGGRGNLNQAKREAFADLIQEAIADSNEIFDVEAIRKHANRLIGQVGCNAAPVAINAAFPVYDFLNSAQKNIAHRAAHDLAAKSQADYERAMMDALLQLDPTQNRFNINFARATERINTPIKRYGGAIFASFLTSAIPIYSITAFALAPICFFMAAFRSVRNAPKETALLTTVMFLGAAMMGSTPILLPLPMLTEYAPIYLSVASTAILAGTAIKMVPSISWNNMASMALIGATGVATNYFDISSLTGYLGLAALGVIAQKSSLEGHNNFATHVITASLLAATATYLSIPTIALMPMASVAANAINGLQLPTTAQAPASAHTMLSRTLILIATSTNPAISILSNAVLDIAAMTAKYGMGSTEKTAMIPDAIRR